MKAQRQEKLRIIKNLLIISSAFFLLFTAYDGLSMLQSTMNKDDGIGTVSQAVVYFSFGISSMLLPKYAVKKLKCKYALLIGIVLFLPYIASNFFPHWLTMMPAALLIGIGASILWGSQCTYFNECAALYSNVDHKDRPSDGDRNGTNNSEYTKSINGVSHIQFKTDKTTDKSNMDNWTYKSTFNQENIDLEKYCEIYSNTNDEKLNELNPQLLSKSKINDLTLSSRKLSLPANNKTLSVILNANILIEEKCDNANYTHESILNVIHLDNEKSLNSTNKEKTIDGTINQILSKPSPKVSKIESTTARFFGFHGLAYYAAQITSNLLSFVVLKSQGIPETKNSFNGSCGFDFCNAELSDDNDRSVPTNLRYLLSSICVASAIAAAVLVFWLLDPLEKLKGTDKENNETSFSMEIIFATLRHCRNKQQLFIIPISVYSGMNQGFYTADFTKSYVSCAWSTAQVGLVSVAYGGCCALASTLSGVLVKYVGRIPVFVTTEVVNIGALLYLGVWRPDSDSPYLFHAGSGLLGLVVGSFWAQLQAFYGILFKDNEEAAFASYYLCSASGWMISFLYSDHLCTSTKIYILGVMSVIGTVGYLMTEKLFRSRKNQFS